jgi:hypothetical protein
MVAASAMLGENTVDRAAATLGSAAHTFDMRTLGVNALNPADYVCPASTPLTDWFLDAVYGSLAADPGNFNLLLNLATDIVPTYEAILFETTATPQFFGYNGEYTKTMVKAERDVKKFWDINSAGIQVVAMHGSALLDTARVATVYRLVFGIPAATAKFYASLVHNAVASSPEANGGNHPLFTFNSVAYSDGFRPDKIIMGDGILAGYSAMGFDDVAPQAVFAHEFAHHIQFAHDYFDDHFATSGSVAEQTQYTELMADAMSAYYLTHKLGGTMNRKRVEQFLQVFFDIGDCAFSANGHHGTPNQRMRAATFGFDIADQAQKQGHILTSAQFHDLFVAAYPGIVAPDAH